MLAVALFPPKAQRPILADGRDHLRDMGGVEHDLGRLPEKIIVTANVMPAIATLMQGLERLQGATNLGTSGMSTALFERIYPGVDGLAKISGDLAPNFEEILRLRPDAVIGWAAQAAFLDKTGFPDFIRLNTRIPSIPGHLAMWHVLENITGTRERSDSLLQSYQTRTKLTEQRLEKSPGPPVRVLVVISNTRELWIGGARHYLNERLGLAGAENVVRAGPVNGQLSLEAVAAFDPDVIVINSVFPEPQPKALYDNPTWSMIRAVRERKVYRTPDWPIFVAPVFDPLLVQWLFEVLHPDANSQLRVELRNAYRQIYNIALNDDDLDGLLALSANHMSEGYDRFK